MSLFKTGITTLHSGATSEFKIDCDYLTDEDIETFARLISKNITFNKVYGIPTGGNRLAEALQKYCQINLDLNLTLIVDDVMTTGNSFLEFRKTINDKYVIGVCIFCRDPIKKPHWVKSIFNTSDDVKL